MKFTGTVRHLCIFFMQFLTKVSPCLPRCGTRTQTLGLVSFSSKKLVRGRSVENLFLSLDINKFLIARGKPFQDINIVSFRTWFSNS